MNKTCCNSIVAVASTIASLCGMAVQTDACTRAVYLGPEDMIVTGRTMDWKEDPQSNIYFFPRGIARRGALTDNTVKWTSSYGSVVTAGYDIGVCDGINEKGLVANLLFLAESDYHRPGDTRPVMGLSIWTQYVLDNFATVDEAVEELGKELFRIDNPDLPNGAKSTLHLSISDPTRVSGHDELPFLRQAADSGRLLGTVGRTCHVAGNQPSVRPFRACVVLYQGTPPDFRLPQCGGRGIQCDAQCVRTARHFNSLAAEYSLHTVAYSSGSKKPCLLF